MRRHDAVPLPEMTEEEGLAADDCDCGSTTVVSELHPSLSSLFLPPIRQMTSSFVSLPLCRFCRLPTSPTG